jgi:hypothetical protein
MKKAMKDPAAVALGRKGGKVGGPARAAKLTAEQRSESARNAVQARWAKAKLAEASVGLRAGRKLASISKVKSEKMVTSPSDRALLALLEQIRQASNPTELRTLSDKLERLIFRKQFKNA